MAADDGVPGLGEAARAVMGSGVPGLGDSAWVADFSGVPGAVGGVFCPLGSGVPGLGEGVFGFSSSGSGDEAGDTAGDFSGSMSVTSSSAAVISFVSASWLGTSDFSGTFSEASIDIKFLINIHIMFKLINQLSKGIN